MLSDRRNFAARSFLRRDHCSNTSYVHETTSMNVKIRGSTGNLEWLT